MAVDLANYEAVSIYPLEPDVQEKLLSEGRECVFNWATKDGWPMGVIMSYMWARGRFCPSRRRWPTRSSTRWASASTRCRSRPTRSCAPWTTAPGAVRDASARSGSPTCSGPTRSRYRPPGKAATGAPWRKTT